jgi:hypothetical protein
VERDQYSLRAFAMEAVETVLNVDGRLLRTLRTLLLKPGMLTAEYFAGRRTPYLRPLQLFLLCNVFFFVAQGLSSARVLNTPLQVHTHHSGHREIAHRWVFGAPHADDETLTEAQETYRTRFDQVVESQSRTLVIVMVPMFAAILAALFIRQRRYMVEHLVFATHFYSFMLLASPFLFLLIKEAVVGLGRLGVLVRVSEDALAVLMTLLWGIYLTHAVRRFYVSGRLPALWRGVALSLVVFVVLAWYRTILFFTAYWAT